MPLTAAPDDPTPASGARPRLHLHIGLPKSGTTSLQELLRHHRSVLDEHGYCYPDVGPSGHFLAALEMTDKGARWGRDADELEGRFGALLDEGRSHGGDVVISHEIFAQARPEQVQAVVAATAGFELHVVLTVRDFGRVLPAAWQEWVKNGKKGSFDDFVELKAARLPGGEKEGELFWRLQNVVEVLDRWGTAVPPERIHVVTCPPPGAARDELWRRFADAIGFPASAVDVAAVPRANESIGAPQVTFLRQVNTALDGRLEEPHGDRIRKHWFAQKLLSRAGGRKAVAPADTVARFAPVSREWVQQIAERGHPVHGDLDDLLPAADAVAAPHPDEVTAQEQLEGLPEAVAEMMLRVRDLEVRAEKAEAEVRRLTGEARSRDAVTPRWRAAATGAVSRVASRAAGLRRPRATTRD